MTTTWQLRFWLIVTAVTILILYLLGDMLLPFVAGMAVAYFLDPVVDRLVKWRLPRSLASFLTLVAFGLAVITVLLLLIPLLRAQTHDLIAAAPGYAEALRGWVVGLVEMAQTRLTEDQFARLREAVGASTGNVVGWIGNVLRRVVTSGMALFNLLALLFVTPVVAFFLLRDWDDMVARIDSWLPRPWAPVIREQAALVDRTLAGFVRGQASVCLLLAVFFAVGLTVVGLDAGLVLGLLAGLLTFIPYVGPMFGVALGGLLAALQFGEWQPVAQVLGVFIVGQVVEGNFLTPKLVGERVGLHPVWVLFALLAGATLFGFLGVLIAVPVAATVGILVRFGLDRYLDSALYQSDLPPEDG
jgi:predicted PurR-regulated permease PerM